MSIAKIVWGGWMMMMMMMDFSCFSAGCAMVELVFLERFWGAKGQRNDLKSEDWGHFLVTEFCSACQYSKTYPSLVPLLGHFHVEQEAANSVFQKMQTQSDRFINWHFSNVHKYQMLCALCLNYSIHQHAVLHCNAPQCSPSSQQE